MVSGCATDPIQLPSFQEAERSGEEVTDPVELTLLCEIPWTTRDCWQRVGVFEDIAIDNTTIAGLNAEIAREGEEAYDHILSGAKQQQTTSLIREEMLALERQGRFWDNVKNWIIIGVVAIVGVTQ